MKKYVMISKDALPKSFIDVLNVKKIIESENISVSEACKKVGTSRSNFYKYQNEVFEPTETYGKKAKILIKSSNSKGVLSRVISLISFNGGNILTINQDLPIHEIAYISFLIEIKEMQISIDELINLIEKDEEIKKVEILAFE